MRIATISREFGSGGRELGKRLADELGFTGYDGEIISAIAEKYDFYENYIESTLRKGLSYSIMLTFGNTFHSPNRMQENEIKILNMQQRIIKELSQLGDCVIIGRSVNVILDEYHPLNLFVYAEMQSKIRRCQEWTSDSENLTEREMEKKIQQIDVGRAKHQKLLTDMCWGEKESYHLWVNSTGMTIKQIISTISDFSRCWFQICESRMS